MRGKFCENNFTRTIKGTHTNADLKISLYVCVHMKTVPWKFRIRTLRIFELFAREVCKFLTK